MKGGFLLVESEILDVLIENLSNESKCLLATLIKNEDEISKEQLRDLSNSLYINSEMEKGHKSPTPLIASRHSLDVHTARLEGAGLVHVREVGRIRLYSITKLGKRLVEYM